MIFVNQQKHNRALAKGRSYNEVREIYLSLGGLIKDDEGPIKEETKNTHKFPLNTVDKELKAKE